MTSLVSVSPWVQCLYLPFFIVTHTCKLKCIALYMYNSEYKIFILVDIHSFMVLLKGDILGITSEASLKAFPGIIKHLSNLIKPKLQYLAFVL